MGRMIDLHIEVMETLDEEMGHAGFQIADLEERSKYVKDNFDRVSKQVIRDAASAARMV